MCSPRNRHRARVQLQVVYLGGESRRLQHVHEDMRKPGKGSLSSRSHSATGSPYLWGFTLFGPRATNSPAEGSTSQGGPGSWDLLTRPNSPAPPFPWKLMLKARKQLCPELACGGAGGQISHWFLGRWVQDRSGGQVKSGLRAEGADRSPWFLIHWSAARQGWAGAHGPTSGSVPPPVI